MKSVISFFVGLGIFIGGFCAELALVKWVTMGIESHDLRVALRIVLFIVGLGFTFWGSLVLGIFLGSLIYYMIGGK